MIVDAATGLQSLGHDIRIYTTHYDPKHCFPETKSLSIIIKGDSLIPRTVYGYGHAVCAYLRSLHCATFIIAEKEWHPDVVVCDQVSVCVPLLKLVAPVLFYCHFPDQLLVRGQSSLLKQMYRIPLDYIEQETTKAADALVVNSQFTRDVFHRTFPSIHVDPEILYPAIRLDAYDTPLDTQDSSVMQIKSDRPSIVSINRFERKKGIKLAIEAFASWRKSLDKGSMWKKTRLVIAGGYDYRVLENVEHHRELVTLARILKLKIYSLLPGVTDVVPEDADVLFLASFTSSQRTYLLESSKVLLYTPENEHFGIVPVEAMYARLPVIACHSGGPVESIENGITGFLVEPTKEGFQYALNRALCDMNDEERTNMGNAGRRRVLDKFSLDKFVHQLDNILQRLVQERQQQEAREHRQGDSFEQNIVRLVLSVTFAMVALAALVYWLSRFVAYV